MEHSTIPKTVHLMIRQALVDWGDYILDTLSESFKDRKISNALENVRERMIDPIRLPNDA